MLIEGFQSISLSTIVWCLVGVFVGMLAGTLPGIGPSSGIAILLPLTFELGALNALVLMMSIYLGAMYGGRISSILVNVPGEPSAVVATFDGYPMTKQGKAGYALTLSAVASFIGGFIGFLGLAFLTAPIAGVALSFGPPEYFALMIFALIATSGLIEKKPFKAILSTLFGLLIATIGLDNVTGEQRLTFGMLGLWEGIDFIVVAIGIFGLSEVLLRIENGSELQGLDSKLTFSSLFPKISEITNNTWSMLRGSLIGFFVGVLPGAGAIVAAFLTYSAEKKISKNPENFGKGEPKGLSAPESACTAAVGGALIPTLSLGVPGSSTTAILLGGLMMAGLQPGPLMFKESGDIISAAMAVFFLANILLLILNTACVPVFSTLVKKLDPYMVPLITVLCFLGVYLMNYSLFEIGVMIFFGIFGYFMRKCGIPLAPLILAVILGPLMEKSLRQSLSITGNDYSIFFTRPISLTLLILTFVILLLPVIRMFMSKRKVSDNDLKEAS